MRLFLVLHGSSGLNNSSGLDNQSGGRFEGGRHHRSLLLLTKSIAPNKPFASATTNSRYTTVLQNINHTALQLG